MELVLDDELLNPDPKLFDQRFVGPKGPSRDVDLYIIGEAAGREEAKEQLPFVGVAGQVLDRAVRLSNAARLNVRYFNTIPYRPITNSGSKTEDRTPTKEEIAKYSVFLMKDIEKVKPKVMLLVGRSAMTAFGIKATEKVGTARNKVYMYKNIPYYVAYHPSFVLRDSGWSIITGGTSRSFESLISDINKALAGGASSRPKPKYQVIDVLDWDKVEAIFQNDIEVTVDYEASGLDTYHDSYFVGGIALKGRTSQAAVYVMLYNFWRTPDEFTIPLKLKARIGVWLLSKRLVVFNLQYECGASLTYFKVYIRNVVDVMMMNRSLGWSGTLKELAATRLKAQTWNTLVDQWNDLIGRIIKGLKPTYKGNIRDDVVFIEDNNLDSIDPLLKWYDNEHNKQSDRTHECRSAFYQIDQIARKYYSGEKYNEFCRRLFALVIKRGNDGDFTTKYTDIPIEIIAPYAMEDAEYTSLLKDDLQAEIDKLGIVRVTEIYNNLAKLGFEMESAGIAWDDQLAAKLDKVYLDKAIDSLRSLLMMPKFQWVLPSPTMSKEKAFVPLIHCHQDVLEVQTATELDNLTKFFNPRSTHKNTRERFGTLINTGRLKFLMMLHEVFKVYQQSKEDCIEEYPVLGPLLEQIISETDTQQRFSMVEALVEGSEGLSYKVQNHPKNDPNLWRDDYNKKIPVPEVTTFIRFSKWELPGMASEVIEDMYNAFWHIGGINVDDESTWVDEFRAVYLFRLYKKVMKSYSTYIWGEVGRGRAALLSKSRIHDLTAPRTPGWREKTPENWIWIKETSFGVCTAVCLCGEVEVLLDNDTSMSVEELYQRWVLGERSFVTYSVLEGTSNLVKRKISDVILTSKETELVEIEFEDGYTVRCTPNHRFLLRNGEYKEARFLTEDDDLMEVRDAV